MILSGSVLEATLGNVQDLGEFKIRNSAKAFSILSSGLYGNKIRAVIRELSTNAVDSHIAAGKPTIPFEVHLPTSLEPYFSVTDYGTGLSHTQIRSLYTTYFESTKTESNDFIGALGLGSKSPFSYIENFTVISVKDGYRGVYTAYINSEGIPGIALMHLESGSTAPNGVTVQLSVDDSQDFYKFSNEAATVFEFFPLKPIITGKTDFRFSPIKYAEKDIIPGVHLKEYNDYPMAVMGNIAYPIDVPNSNKTLGELSGLLNYPLVMHFEIGELDFQANREGLSYIPQTINAIKKKLEALSAHLIKHVASKVDHITSVWEKAGALTELHNSYMFQRSVKEYCEASKFPLFNSAHARQYHWQLLSPIKMDINQIAKAYNIALTGVRVTTTTSSAIREHVEYGAGSIVNSRYFEMRVANDIAFVITDTKVGAVNRAKNHFRTKLKADSKSPDEIYIMTAADDSKPMDTDAFLASIYNPPTVLKASELIEIPRKTKQVSLDKVGVLHLVRASEYRSDELVWRSAGTVADYANKTVYYIPLSGYKPLMEVNFDIYQLADNLRQSVIPEFKAITIVGVRKSEIKAIDGLKNWINLEVYLKKTLLTYTNFDIIALSNKMVDSQKVVCYPNKEVNALVGKDSEFSKLNSLFNHRPPEKSYRNSYSDLSKLCDFYKTKFNSKKVMAELDDKCSAVLKKYPLLAFVDPDKTATPAAIAQYINLVDSVKE